jgi:hypothetical protein
VKTCASAFLAVLVASARGDPARQPQASPVLVELFTSEGCSSCPPADAVLARLLTGPPGGAQVVALEEHVDYWDALGWKDRFSAAAFTDRQEAYVRRLGLSGAYTPQLVVNGRTQVLGGDEPAAREAISAAASTAAGVAQVHRLESDAGQLTIAVGAEWAGGGPADVILALVQDHARTSVEAGENAGRVLDHVAVVRSLTRVARGVGSFRGTVRVPLPVAEGTDRVVVIVQEPDAGAVKAVASEVLGRPR